MKTGIAYRGMLQFAVLLKKLAQLLQAEFPLYTKSSRTIGTTRTEGRKVEFSLASESAELAPLPIHAYPCLQIQSAIARENLRPLWKFASSFGNTQRYLRVTSIEGERRHNHQLDFVRYSVTSLFCKLTRIGIRISNWTFQARDFGVQCHLAIVRHIMSASVSYFS